MEIENIEVSNIKILADHCSGFLMSLCVHNIDINEIIQFITIKLKESSDIKDKYKRNTIKNQLTNLLNIVKSQKVSLLNCIFFINDKKTYKIDIDPVFCTFWELPHIIYFPNEFNIPYFNDIFNNLNTVHVVHIDKTNTLYHGTRYKRKILQNNVDVTLLSQPYITHGKVIENNKAILALKGSKKWDEIILAYDDFIMSKNINKLKLILDELTNPKKNNLYLFSNEIDEALSDCLIKDLYVVQGTISEKYKNVDVNIIILKSLNKGDSADILDKNYGGVLGIKYY